MRTTNDYIKEFYLKSTEETVTDEQIQEVLDDTEAIDQEPRMVLVNMTELIKSVHTEAIQAAGDLVFNYFAGELSGVRLKNSILSLINELK